MNVRAQISSVFHLDKCIGCHTCSVACKNQWTDRKGVEYAWWNNVETKPGAGYPVWWEDQEKHRGGWKVEAGRLGLRQASPAGTLARIFHNPGLPVLQNYYEPWTYRYDDLFTAPAGADQPTARPISLIDGRFDLQKLLILSPFDPFTTLFTLAKLQNERAISVPQ